MKNTRIVIVGVIAIGLIICALMIFNMTPDLVDDAGYEALQNNGGSMDTESYLRVMDYAQAKYERYGFLLGLLGSGGIFITAWHWISAGEANKVSEKKVSSIS